MRSNYIVWIGLLIFAALVTLAMKFYAYFPGDVAIENGIQSLLPLNLNWAEVVSKALEFPWIMIVLALIFALSWILAGWRAALLSVLSLVGMLALGKWFGPVIGRPRPSSELVRVFRPLSGYSFPSSFALRYAATFGFLAVLAWTKNPSSFRTLILIVCRVLLILGFVVRVSLAAHWPSDVIISYLIGFLWASLLVRFA